MNAPLADIAHLMAALADLAEDLALHLEDHQQAPMDDTPSFNALLEALRQFFDLLYAQQTGEQTLNPDELSELGNYGLDLLQSLAQEAEALDFPRHQAFEDLSFPLGLWLARNQAEISILGPIVNNLARLANRLTQPEQLENLFSQSSEIDEAISVRLSQDLEHNQTGTAWSVFLINRGIIATRSLNPDLIATAYDAIIEHLPELAQDFLAEAMEQMEALEYPRQVRHFVESYFNHWNNHKRLH